MSNYTWVEELRIVRFSSRALVLVSRFARALKQMNGTKLDLQDPMIAGNIMGQVRKTRNPDLKKIFDQLLIELHILVERGDAKRCPEVVEDQDLIESIERRICVAKDAMKMSRPDSALLN